MHTSVPSGAFRTGSDASTFADGAWRLSFPNFADTFPFDYPRLLDASYADNIPLGTLKSGKEKRIAIIGAGIAGTQAARELVRAGYCVDIYEYTDRIGGRTCTTRAPATTGNKPTASMTTYEMGAMRIPFFNQTAPKPGPGPFVGGPYVDNDFHSCTSMSEFYAKQYKIATAPFPNPGRAEMQVSGGIVPGVHTGIYVNGGSGVDIEAMFGEGVPEVPTHRFTYSWPATTEDLKNWPQSDPVACKLVKFYSRGEELEVQAPGITLEHPIPMEDTDIPRAFLNATDSYDVQTANIEAWRLGVTAIRIIYYKWSMFANAVRFTFLGDRSRFENPFAGGEDDPFLSTQYNNNHYCGKCSGCDENAEHKGCRLWDKFWRNQVMPRYQNVSFFEMATAPPVLPEPSASGDLAAPIAWAKGNFGGLGMSGPEAQLFYTIGAGDGSWGAFFPNSALWALRALLFGFAQEHQLVLGCLDEKLDNVDMDPVGDGSLVPDVTPEMTPQPSIRGTLMDSSGKAFMMPQFTGVNAYSECHFFKPIGIVTDEDGCEYRDTLWKRVQSDDGKVRLFTSTKVTGFEAGDSCITVKTDDHQRVYHSAICTVPLWNINEMELTKFPPRSISSSVKTALDVSHWIRSAKVFVALKEPFWKQGAADTRDTMMFPQVMSTNSILRDVYGLAAPSGSDPFPTTGGVALISYTWEDDAQKFMAYDSADLVKLLLKRVEELFEAFPAKDLKDRPRPKFSDFMLDPTLTSPGSYKVWQWSKQPSYHGCAKAYQSGIEDLSFSLLTHNKKEAKQSRLYFAGDAYSLESGWMEPAQRMSVDAVLNLLNHDDDATLNCPHRFDFAADYLHPNAISTRQSGLKRQLGDEAPTSSAFRTRPRALSNKSSQQRNESFHRMSGLDTPLSFHDE